MKHIEVKIISKIIRELSHFLITHGFKNFQIETNIESKVTYFKITLDDLKPPLLEKMKERISRERELEVETYGWELLGDTDEKNELDVLGLLIDKIEFQKIGEKTRITLSRESRYKD